MKILVFNAGSSSLKFGVFDLEQADSRVFKGEFSGISHDGCTLQYRAGGEKGSEKQRHENICSIADAIGRVPALLQEFGCEEFAAVGHRVVHGGELFRAATQIDDEVMQQIERCTPLAPLHNPASLAALRLSRDLWPAIPQVAVFDTAFHQTMPDYASTYAVPKEWRAMGVRRYGFHGTSHHYVALRAAEALRRPLEELRLISCHLGNGASVCAISNGKSVDTSMGMTPLEGLVMGTRAGDIDAGLFTFLEREAHMDSVSIEQQLNQASGLQALCGSYDMREIVARAANGDADSQLALRTYAYRVRKYIGAYAAAMGGLDAVVFTGGIGENSAEMRRRVCERLEFLGLYLDDERNRGPELADFAAPQIQSSDSRVRVVVTQTNEQYMIAREVQRLLAQPVPQHAQPVRIPVAVSARHVHLSPQAVDQLFGPGHQLRLARRTNQAEGWAAEETVELLGPKGSLSHVRVLGPTRSATQIEISRTDAYTLGLDPPLRPSGQLENTPVITLRGPAGDYHTDGLIIAARHIHMHPSDAERLGLHDGAFCEVIVGEGDRRIRFTHTLVRVKDSYSTEMHIDTDEANAAGISFYTSGELLFTANS